MGRAGALDLQLELAKSLGVFLWDLVERRGKAGESEINNTDEAGVGRFRVRIRRERV